ncbi:cytochrome P460 family protein [Roseitranquillus sediminis]|uniref:cytochrome P460 family protein n=1 Tax=Roseitranquillus sediminis TaxID=2809051 RepID=UPI001D0BFA62|nr:cytochrome P460 family protein [Roseitranquillus sediminis]MBM9595969.1 cytochrome P460 family protein [Roseitranquillus sediminis]
MTRTTTLIAGLALASTAATAQNFGTEADVDYAAQLWQAMVETGLAGDGAVQALPYEGVEPHGLMLETFYTRATIDGHDGALVIKRNYGPAGVTADEVISDRMAHLAAVTIMFQRAEGYDDETGNWFYAKYLPDGSLEPNPSGVPLAGLVGKGGDAGCIPCHAAAGGDDYLYTTDADLE